MSNHTTKMAQVYIQINGNLHFFSNLHNVDDLENVLLQIKIFDVNILMSAGFSLGTLPYDYPVMHLMLPPHPHPNRQTDASENILPPASSAGGKDVFSPKVGDYLLSKEWLQNGH